MRVSPKKTSIHLGNQTDFGGVHVRKSSIILTIRLNHPLESPRVIKAEQASKNRYHLDVRLERVEDVDAELLGWLKESYGQAGDKG